VPDHRLEDPANFSKRSASSMVTVTRLVWLAFHKSL
jgi:hypothetical protein